MGFLGGLLGGGGAGGIMNMVGGILGGFGKTQGAGNILQTIGGALGGGGGEGGGGGDIFGMITNLLQGILGKDQAAMTPAGQPSQLGLGG